MNKNFNFLGLARRANVLFIGQDNVLSALNDNAEMYILTSIDVSPALLRKVRTKISSSSSIIVNTGLTRNEIGDLLGIHAASIIAIEKSNTFAEKIKLIAAK